MDKFSTGSMKPRCWHAGSKGNQRDAGLNFLSLTAKSKMPLLKRGIVHAGNAQAQPLKRSAGEAQNSSQSD
jgi:hypothetical protein